MAFRIKRAETQAEHEALYRIRHRVFIEEMKYGEKRADGRMLDRFDELPDTGNLIAVAGQDIVAGVRLVEPGKEGSPTDVFYDFSAHIPAGVRMPVGGMLFVAPAFRSQRAMMHALMGCFYSWVMMRGFKHVLAVVAPAAERFLAREGFRSLCPRFFHEKLKLYATPMMLDMTELEPGLRRFATRHQLGGAEVFERRFFSAEEPVPLSGTEGELSVLRGRLRLERPGTWPAPLEFGEGAALDAARLRTALVQGARLVASAAVELALVSLRAPAQARGALAHAA